MVRAVLFVLAAYGVAVHAMVGEVDIADKFPFVVSLSSEVGGCSGVASRAGLVSTAAHCVWSESTGVARNMRITFKDADGRIRTVKSRKIFIPPEYVPLERTWLQSDRSSSSSADQKEIDFIRAAIHDIAFIVPDSWVETEGFPHWITEILDYDGRMTTSLESYFGDLTRASALSIGYGKYLCKDFNSREADCVSDGNRRSATVPLVGRYNVGGNTFGFPDVWITGRNADGINPIQHGDSGGPVFVRALDGRWMLMGYTSGGNNRQSYASSILSNLSTWKAAAEYYDDNSSSIWNGGGASNWDSHQTFRLISEILDVWSSPNSVVLKRLERIYEHVQSACGTSQTEKDESIAAWKRFIEKWPNRRYQIVADSDEFIPDDLGEPQRYNGMNITYAWTLSNDDGSVVRNGKTRAEFQFRFNFERELSLVNGGNPPILQSERLISTTGSDDEILCGRIPSAPPSAPPSPAAPAGSTLWDHNGSIVSLKADKLNREFYYEQPRSGLQAYGVEPGTLLFSGKRSGKSYSGTAYVFTKSCGVKPYQVSGPISENDEQVTMTGQAPRVDSNCQITGYRDDTLVFTLRKP